jgi:glucokinase-like ROK family protein
MVTPGRLRTGDQTLVREINLSVILSQLRERAPISRASLAEITGLNKTTVSSLVQALIDTKFVYENGVDTSGMGRPSVLLELNPSAGYVIAGEIGVDFVNMLCADFVGNVIWQKTERTRQDMGQQAILNRTLVLLHEASTACSGRCNDNLLGVALGVPGLINYSTGTLLFAPNLGWQDVPLRDIIARHFDGEIFIDNEANLSALAEHFFGPARSFNEVLFISAGVGLGGGIVRNGHIHRGASGFAGEFGHMTADPDGELCSCGNHGCWEMAASQSAVFQAIRKSIQNGRHSTLAEVIEQNEEELTIPLVVQAVKQGDQVALEALQQVGHYLGIGIASLVNAVNPDLIVFGGILSLAGEYLLPVIERELAARALQWNARATQIVIARYGSNACSMGGVATVVKSILEHPLTMIPQAG